VATESCLSAAGCRSLSSPLCGLRVLKSSDTPYLPRMVMNVLAGCVYQGMSVLNGLIEHQVNEAHVTLPEMSHLLQGT
jgi:hypothetical protein